MDMKNTLALILKYQYIYIMNSGFMIWFVIEVD